ncbi:MAG: AmmeMemoRadiSam system protein B, partial [Planctomycetes bacterium]|nr:AmmeMemoRadiSam system protein B [Planctomycetota bacterium]
MTSPRELPTHPAVRALDLERVTHEGVPGIVLHDRMGLSESTFLPQDLLPIVGRCDGSRTVLQIRDEASEQVGEEIPIEFVAGLVQQLDERGLLLGPTYDGIATAAADAFLAAGVRPARHAGSAGYPRDPAMLRAALHELVTPPPEATAPLRGLVAPHIDLARGAAGYAAAYRRLLAAPPADLYVLFGTGHAGPDAPVTGLPLDWQTPLGTVATDRQFVAAVHERIGAAAPIDLLHHRDEHSLEFQVLLLQHLHQRRGGERPLQVAAFLCGALPSVHGDPLAEDWCQDLLAAFRAAEAASGKTVCYLAGADLAHIGPIFGDEASIDDARLEQLAAAERARLEHLQAGVPGAFHAAVDCDRNPDRVCSG